MRPILLAVFALLLPMMAAATEPTNVIYLTAFAVDNPADSQQRERAAQLDEALLRALQARQIQVKPVSQQAALPTRGWLVQGQVSSEAGRRLVRTVVGFGAGASNVEAHVWLSNLAAEEQQQLTAQDRSKRLPGALVTRNPQLAAAKFLLERRALNRNIDECGRRSGGRHQQSIGQRALIGRPRAVPPTSICKRA